MMPDLPQNKTCHMLLNFGDPLWTGALNMPKPLKKKKKNSLEKWNFIFYKYRIICCTFFGFVCFDWNQSTLANILILFELSFIFILFIFPTNKFQVKWDAVLFFPAMSSQFFNNNWPLLASLSSLHPPSDTTHYSFIPSSYSTTYLLHIERVCGGARLCETQFARKRPANTSPLGTWQRVLEKISSLWLLLFLSLQGD